MTTYIVHVPIWVSHVVEADDIEDAINEAVFSRDHMEGSYEMFDDGIGVCVYDEIGNLIE